jgi:tripartite-type tricarboxylate transporter receptor subunit TctC
MAAFAKMAGMEVVHVPYRGGGPAMTEMARFFATAFRFR